MWRKACSRSGVADTQKKHGREARLRPPQLTQDKTPDILESSSIPPPLLHCSIVMSTSVAHKHASYYIIAAND